VKYELWHIVFTKNLVVTADASLPSKFIEVKDKKDEKRLTLKQFIYNIFI